MVYGFYLESDYDESKLVMVSALTITELSKQIPKGTYEVWVTECAPVLYSFSLVPTFTPK